MLASELNDRARPADQRERLLVTRCNDSPALEQEQQEDLREYISQGLRFGSTHGVSDSAASVVAFGPGGPANDGSHLHRYSLGRVGRGT
jgi:hypothetical protein